MQDKASKRPKRKYGKIKKNFISAEEAEEELKKNVQSVEEKLRKINIIKSLKVDTPWTTGSSDEGTSGYLYYKIQQAKKSKFSETKYNKIFDYLDTTGVVQIDFSGMLKESHVGKNSNALFKKAQQMSENQTKAAQPSSLLLRRKLQAMRD